SSQTARTLIQWIVDESAWLWPDMEFAADEDIRQFWDRLPALADAIDTDEDEAPPAMAAATAVADLLAFSQFDRELLRLVGRLAGADAGSEVQRVRRSEPVTLGLVYAGGSDGRDLCIDWAFN